MSRSFGAVWPRRCPAVYAERLTAWPSCHRAHWELEPLRQHIDRAHRGYELSGWRPPDDPGEVPSAVELEKRLQATARDIATSYDVTLEEAVRRIRETLVGSRRPVGP